MKIATLTLFIFAIVAISAIAGFSVFQLMKTQRSLTEQNFQLNNQLQALVHEKTLLEAELRTTEAAAAAATTAAELALTSAELRSFQSGFEEGKVEGSKHVVDQAAKEEAERKWQAAREDAERMRLEEERKLQEARLRAEYEEAAAARKDRPTDPVAEYFPEVVQDYEQKHDFMANEIDRTKRPRRQREFEAAKRNLESHRTQATALRQKADTAFRVKYERFIK